MNESNLVALTGIGGIAIACQWLAWRVKLPAILFLLLAGIVAGPVTGWLNPDRLFGDLLFPFVSLSVAIILFEGSLTLKFDQIRDVRAVVRRLVTVGLLVTWIVTSVSTHWLVDFSWELSFLFGALVVVTGPTVIIPLLRTVRPNSNISNILRWEGIVIDPIGALLAVLVFDFIISTSGGAAWQHVMITFGGILFVGITTGLLGGYVLGLILRYFLIPEYLHNLATLSLVFATFTSANLLAEESGLLAVTVMGMLLANMKRIHTEDILNFKEHLSVLLISGLFIILAARIEFVQFYELGWAAFGVLAAIQFVARPLKVIIATLGSSLTYPERALIAWIAPRGIVAAAVSALFALRLEQIGLSQAQLIVPLTFLVIIGTVVLQSITSRGLANLLKVAEPEASGVLILGANPLAIKIASALNELGFRTVLTDSNWMNIRTARMAGLKTYYGNLVSEHADQHLDLVGIGRMLALSPQTELNALASIRFRSEFGRNAVYVLPPPKEKSEKQAVATKHSGDTLFSKDATYAKLASLVSQGAEIRVTQLSSDFDYQAFQEKHGKRVVPLFAVNSKMRLKVFVAGGDVSPQPGWTIVSLIQETQSDNIPETVAEPTSASV